MGELASSKSAMNTLAPELSALMTILRSTGPVISTRRSCRSAGNGRDLPFGLTNGLGLGKKVGQLAGVDVTLADAARQQFLAARLECRAQAHHKIERVLERMSACAPVTGAAISNLGI